MIFKWLLLSMHIGACLSANSENDMKCLDLKRLFRIPLIRNSAYVRLLDGEFSDHILSTKYSKRVQLPKNDEDFEARLSDADGKLVVISFIHGKVASCEEMKQHINYLANKYTTDVVIIIVDAAKCQGTYANYYKETPIVLSNSRYVFRLSNQEVCRYTGVDKGKNDCIFIDHKIKELLNLTRVQIASDCADFDKKLTEAGQNWVLVVFTENKYNLFCRDCAQPWLELLADQYPSLLIIQVQLREIVMKYLHYDTRPRYNYIFIRSRTIKAREKTFEGLGDWLVQFEIEKKESPPTK